MGMRGVVALRAVGMAAMIARPRSGVTAPDPNAPRACDANELPTRAPRATPAQPETPAYERSAARFRGGASAIAHAMHDACDMPSPRPTTRRHAKSHPM